MRAPALRPPSRGVPCASAFPFLTVLFTRDFVTGQQTADAMAQLMRAFCDVGAQGHQHFTVCDAFACVGGNSLAFARLGFSVVALEVPNC